MTALEKWRAESLCPLCGFPKEVCQSPQTEYRVSVPDPTRCHITTAIKKAQDARVKRYGDSLKFEDGLLWAVTLRD